jgi:hypothetical protein
MGLRVVGAGLGRTGTNSLKVALEQLLGGPCYHMVEVMKHDPDHPQQWAAAYAGELPDWSQLFADYVAAVDWPAGPFWQPLSEANPDALILLSTRDPDAWWRSASSTIFLAMERAYFSPDSEDNAWAQMCGRMMASFCPDWREEEPAKAAFAAYNDQVRRTAPTDRLLEWSPGDGWEPICERLGLPVPTEPFPHTNTADEFRAMTGLTD